MPTLCHSTSSPQQRILKASLLASAFFLLASCQSRTSVDSQNNTPELIVAAAANLTNVSAEIGQRFTYKTGIRVIFAFGATTDLAKQIENGAPFDVFMAGDVTNVDHLDQQGLLTADTRAIYARGRLVVWFPTGSNLRIQRIQDITAEEFERIAIAKPDIAPYGQAAVESLRAVGLWDQIEPRVIYAQNVAQTKQFAATGNAEVAFIPLALVKTDEGEYLEVDQNLHRPIDQALAIVKATANQTAARQFVDFMLSDQGQQILAARGYRRAQ
jgi:molybdate transport system substrate-binding protein